MAHRPIQHAALNVRYDEQTQRYRDCRWCAGRGCLACPAEAAKAYKAAFPDGPKPIATFTAAEIPAARAAIGAEAVTKAFAPGGGGINEIIENVAKAKGGGDVGT